MGKISDIIEKEELDSKIGWTLLAMRENLLAKGYTRDDTDTAIARALPVCIASALIEDARSHYVSDSLERNATEKRLYQGICP